MTTRLKAVYAVVSQERLGRPAYRRIGTGFANRDGSISVVLDAFPTSGRLHISDVDLSDVEYRRNNARVTQDKRPDA